MNITYIKINLCTGWDERRWPDLDLVSPRKLVTLHRSCMRCLRATVLEWFSCCGFQTCRHLSFDLYFFSFVTFYSVFFFSSFCQSLLQSYYVLSSNSLLLISLIITFILLTFSALMIFPSPLYLTFSTPLIPFSVSLTTLWDIWLFFFLFS